MSLKNRSIINPHCTGYIYIFKDKGYTNIFFKSTKMREFITTKSISEEPKKQPFRKQESYEGEISPHQQLEHLLIWQKQFIAFTF